MNNQPDTDKEPMGACSHNKAARVHRARREPTVLRAPWGRRVSKGCKDLRAHRVRKEFQVIRALQVRQEWMVHRGRKVTQGPQARMEWTGRQVRKVLLARRVRQGSISAARGTAGRFMPLPTASHSADRVTSRFRLNTNTEPDTDVANERRKLGASGATRRHRSSPVVSRSFGSRGFGGRSDYLPQSDCEQSRGITRGRICRSHGAGCMHADFDSSCAQTRLSASEIQSSTRCESAALSLCRIPHRSGRHRAFLHDGPDHAILLVIDPSRYRQRERLLRRERDSQRRSATTPHHVDCRCCSLSQ